MLYTDGFPEPVFVPGVPESTPVLLLMDMPVGSPVAVHVRVGEPPSEPYVMVVIARPSVALDCSVADDVTFGGLYTAMDRGAVVDVFPFPSSNETVKEYDVPVFEPLPALGVPESSPLEAFSVRPSCSTVEVTAWSGSAGFQKRACLYSNLWIYNTQNKWVQLREAKSSATSELGRKDYDHRCGQGRKGEGATVLRTTQVALTGPDN